MGRSGRHKPPLYKRQYPGLQSQPGIPNKGANGQTPPHMHSDLQKLTLNTKVALGSNGSTNARKKWLKKCLTKRLVKST